MWDVLFSYILALIEPSWCWQLTQIIMGVLSIARAVQVWLTSEIPCLPVLDVFSSVCVLHVPQVLTLPSSCLLYVHDIDNYSIFEPIPSCLCVHVNVEMTSIVELFSDRFSFSVKSGMWTDQCCPFRTVACAACVLLIIHSASNPSLILLPSSLNYTSLGQYGLKDTDIFWYYLYLPAITQTIYWFMLFWESLNHFVPL